MTAMDLDLSLDDLIKQKKNNKKAIQEQKNGAKGQRKSNGRANLQFQTKAKINKAATPSSKSNIISRLSTSSKYNSLTTPHTKPNPKADPSQIIITKAIPIQSPKNRSVFNTNKEVNKPVPKSKNSSGQISNELLNRLGSRQAQPTQVRPTQVQPTQAQSTQVQPTQAQPTQVQPTQQIASKTITSERPSISIRGRSKPTTPGLSMRDDTGLTTILICGLDRGTNSEDLRVVCEGFGHVLHCEVLRNRMGESFGEAEVEFSTKKAAFDCIAKLDNARADDYQIYSSMRNYVSLKFDYQNKFE